MCVIATARRPETLLSLKEAGASILKLDVISSPHEIKAVAQEAVSTFGRVDYLINNAGFLQGGAIEENTAEDNLAQFNTNLFGVINVANVFLPYFRARKQGTIVNMSSQGSFLCRPGAGIYCASKTALEAISDRWAHELLGGFRTSIAESNMKVAAAKIDGYDAAHDWVTNFNRAAGKERGDTKIAAAKIIELISVDPDRKLPLRLALGDDAHDNARLFYMKRLEDLEGLTAESTGTDAAW